VPSIRKLTYNLIITISIVSMAVIIRNSEETLVTNEKPEKKNTNTIFLQYKFQSKFNKAPLKCKTKGINNRSLQLKSGSKKN
jgi:hypothetical protein